MVTGRMNVLHAEGSAVSIANEREREHARAARAPSRAAAAMTLGAIVLATAPAAAAAAPATTGSPRSAASTSPPAAGGPRQAADLHPAVAPPEAERPEATVTKTPAAVRFDHEERGDNRALTLGAIGGFYGVLYGYTYLAWYYRSEASPTFRLYDDGMFGVDTYAGGADKLGHMWSNYAAVRMGASLLEYGGWSRRFSLATATTMAVGFWTVAEVKDGYHAKYGFSLTDIYFNLAGNLLGVAMELSPTLDEMFDFRVQYFPSEKFLDSVESEGPFNSPEDYNGQTFYVAYHLASIPALQGDDWLGYLQYADLALGFQAYNYRPRPTMDERPSQNLFFGVSLNIQRIIDKTLMAPDPLTRQVHAGAGSRVLRFASEVYSVPFTTLRLGSVAERSTDPDVVNQH